MVEVLKSMRCLFPTDPEERLEAISSCINAETKIVTLAIGLDDNPKTSHEIRESISEYSGNSWLPGDKTFAEYCHTTLLPIGLVTEELIIPKYKLPKLQAEPVLSWRLTEDGSEYAKPAAILAAEYALKKDKSMFLYLGSAYSSGKSRAPYNRVKILKELEKGPKRIADLAERLNLYENAVLSHLKVFKNLGLVEYESVSTETSGWGVYKWVEGKNPECVKTHLSNPIATLKVSHALAEIKEGDYQSLSEKTKYSPHTVSTILSHLERTGFAERKYIWKGREVLSRVSITKEGISFIKEFIEPLEKILSNGEELRKDLASKDIGSFVPLLLSLYQEVSPNLNRRSRQEQYDRIISFIKAYQSKNQYGPRAKEILGELKISSYHLKHLIDEGILEKRKEGKQVRYFLSNI